MSATNPAGHDQLERELQYYKSEYNALGARMVQVQEQQGHLAREARRNKIVARLVREAYAIGSWDMPAEAIGGPVLATVADNSLCDRAVFLKHTAGLPGNFTVEHAFGGEVGAMIDLPDPPKFFFTAANQPPSAVGAVLTGLMDVPYVLWSYDAESERALLLGKRFEGNIHRPFEAGDQEIIEVALAVYHDVLLRKRAEAMLVEAKRVAEAANEARARFLANLSHELRTPLNAIIGFSEMLLETGARAPLPAEREEFTRQILDAGQNLAVMARDILDFSSLSHAGPQLRIDWIPLSYLLYSAVRALAAQIADTGVQIEVIAPPPGLQAAIDYDRFRQILANLLGNALKFTPRRTGRITIWAALTPQTGLEICVRDNGIGIRAEDLPRILEPFVQVKNAEDYTGLGAGLGLPIAKQLVEAHEGVLRIESVFGQGTTVTVLLPASKARLLDDQPA